MGSIDDVINVDPITFPRSTFWCITLYFKSQPLHILRSWSLDGINFVKNNVQSTEQNTFLKKSRDQVGEIIDQLYLSKRIPDVSFNIISCKIIRKWWVGILKIK